MKLEHKTSFSSSLYKIVEYVLLRFEIFIFDFVDRNIINHNLNHYVPNLSHAITYLFLSSIVSFLSPRTSDFAGNELSRNLEGLAF